MGSEMCIRDRRSLASLWGFGWGKGGNVTSAGWQVTLCDPIWYVSSRSGDRRLRLQTAIGPLRLFTFTFLLVGDVYRLYFVWYCRCTHELFAVNISSSLSLSDVDCELRSSADPAAW